MALFDFLFGKKDKPEGKNILPVVPNQELLNPVEVLPGITLPKALADHWPLIAATKRTFLSIKAFPAENFTIRQSKFGHYPCLPKGFPYPTDTEGKYMIPLAQINCSEYPGLPGLPASGYLQFYIADDDMYGLDYKNPQIQSGFRVLFFEEYEVQDPQQDFSFLTDTLSSEGSPLEGPHRLEFATKDECAGMNDHQAGASPATGIIPLCEQYPAIEDDLMQALYDTFPSNGHKMGGYIYTTQVDPRVDDPELMQY